MDGLIERQVRTSSRFRKRKQPWIPKVFLLIIIPPVLLPSEIGIPFLHQSLTVVVVLPGAVTFYRFVTRTLPADVESLSVAEISQFAMHLVPRVSNVTKMAKVGLSHHPLLHMSQPVEFNSMSLFFFALFFTSYVFLVPGAVDALR